MGKNFSCDNTGKRRKADYYQTPYSMTNQFMERFIFDFNFDPADRILEPASGEGAISKVLSTFGTKVDDYDLDRHGLDFFAETRNFDWIITNPPYSLANEFVLHALTLANKGVAMLLPLNYLQGEKRYRTIFEDNPPVKLYVFTRMPMLTGEIREDGKYETGMQSYAWYVWIKGFEGTTTIEWISNQQFVKRKGE